MRDYDYVNVGFKFFYRSCIWDSFCGYKYSRYEENCYGGDESFSSIRDGSVEREIYKELWYVKEILCYESKWFEYFFRY